MPEDPFFVDPFEPVVVSDEAWEAIIAQEPAKPRVSTSAARRAYGAPVPDGFHLHHICRNRWCGKAEHLVAVSPADHLKLHAKESFCA